ncbi:GNAT family N-acetyltransferase [Paenibacillus protaetiae]|uniref:GNAT family N-acetyltransferase n=1 Tax=Paenibacillus protaetiae TaxID=2509456 RepID=UPI001FC9A148|nr:GNAT family N-acetyltransferase [Paenibacillus protaetiae]
MDCGPYMDNDHKAILFAFDGDRCVGQLRIVRDWTRFAYIENIAVKKEYRKAGIGRYLFEAGERWAKEKGLRGISLEAQDDNLAACRFYIRMGMQLGGVDAMKYTFNPNIDKALFWYKPFEA